MERQMIKMFVCVSTVQMLTGCASNAVTETPSVTHTPTVYVTSIPAPASTVEAINLHGGSIIKDDIDNLNRADLWAIIPNADSLTENEIQECMRGLINGYIADNKVTAVTLYLADTVDDVNRSSYTLGRCMYYPGGDISNSINTEPGEYSTFVFKYETHSRVGKNVPTDREIEIYNYVNAELEKTDDEDTVNKKAANRFGISIDELNEIWAKVYTYKH